MNDPYYSDTEGVLNRFDAQTDWDKARRKVLYRDVVCMIKRCSVDLLNFADVQKDLSLHQKKNIGLQFVLLENIRGSVGRFDDFNAAFMPRKDFMRDRWQQVEVAMLEGKTPPVDLYKVGDDYYVVDGNHRVSVARARGLETIEAYVTDFILPAEKETTELDDMFIETERSEFLEKIGSSNTSLADDIVVTCAGCYEVISDQVEEYHRGRAFLKDVPYPFEQAFKDWHKEIYTPSILSIQENDLLSRFPDRTPADLYVWATQNKEELEDLEGGSESAETPS